LKSFMKSSSQAHSQMDSSKREYLHPDLNWVAIRKMLILLNRYARILARVDQNPNLEERAAAQNLLGWITCSKRSLKWHEIQAAVSINQTDQSVDFEQRQLRTHAKDICGSLIDVLPGDRVQLVHGTAKE
jgi:hypothetical protein